MIELNDFILSELLTLLTSPSKIKGDVKKEGDTITITFKKEAPKFNDTEVKEMVSEYKRAIKDINDDLFLEVVEELKSKLDLKKFNDLLDLESFTEEQAKEVEEMIDISSDIICLHLKHKIQDMVELYEQF